MNIKKIIEERNVGNKNVDTLYRSIHIEKCESSTIRDKYSVIEDFMNKWKGINWERNIVKVHNSISLLSLKDLLNTIIKDKFKTNPVFTMDEDEKQLFISMDILCAPERFADLSCSTEFVNLPVHLANRGKMLEVSIDELEYIISSFVKGKARSSYHTLTGIYEGPLYNEIATVLDAEIYITSFDDSKAILIADISPVDFSPKNYCVYTYVFESHEDAEKALTLNPVLNLKPRIFKSGE